MLKSRRQFTKSNRQVLEDVLAYAEKAYADSKPRLRPNLPRSGEAEHPDGQIRNYICHPLELAFVMSKVVVCERALAATHKPRTYKHIKIADEIIAAIELAAILSQDELKTAILDMANLADQPQLIAIAGFILHDVYEEKGRKKATAEEEMAVIKKEERKIISICKGAEKIVREMTDPPTIRTKEEKRAYQVRRAAIPATNRMEANAKLGKFVDNLLNMYDLALIQGDVRSFYRTMEIFYRLNECVQKAIGSNGIPLSFIMAGDRIRKRTSAQLNSMAAAYG